MKKTHSSRHCVEAPERRVHQSSLWTCSRSSLIPAEGIFRAGFQRFLPSSECDRLNFFSWMKQREVGGYESHYQIIPTTSYHWGRPSKLLSFWFTGVDFFFFLMLLISKISSKPEEVPQWSKLQSLVGWNEDITDYCMCVPAETITWTPHWLSATHLETPTSLCSY